MSRGNRMVKANWAVALVDISIMIFTFSVAYWQDDPNYLWLICLMFASGSLVLDPRGREQ